MEREWQQDESKKAKKRLDLHILAGGENSKILPTPVKPYWSVLEGRMFSGVMNGTLLAP